MKLFGLIGRTLSHSFSQKFFRQKFAKENIQNCTYKLFELMNISEFEALIKQNKELKGVNVTIPYKEEIIPFLDELDPIAQKVQAVNVVKFDEGGRKIGYNTDYLGFRGSLHNWMKSDLENTRALVLGTGGASKAVQVVLSDSGIDFKSVSRNPTQEQLSYEALRHDLRYLDSHQLIINTTPLGNYPNIDQCPDLEYDRITSRHHLFDLIYNPEETLFLKKGSKEGASVKNGLEMLEIQAEESWLIWNS